VERRSQSAVTSIMGEWQESARGAATALSTTDGRWALVSTSLTALIAGTIAWLAVGTMPPMKAHSLSATQTTFLPYQLFQKLTHSSGNYASIAPFSPPSASPTAPVIQSEEDTDDVTAGIETRTITMDRGDTLAGLLEDSGISSDDANAAVVALGKVYNSRSVRAGQSFELTYSTDPQKASGGDASDFTTTSGDDGAAATPVAHLISISFSPSIEHDITIARDGSNAFAATDTVKQLQEHHHRAGATIEGSLYLSAMRAGIPADVVVEMIHMFSYEVDFQRDIHPNDTFEVYYSYYYTPEGQPARNGNIAFATMHLGGRTVTLYRYQPDPNQPADYFDAHGQSAKSMLMKTPVDGARITSGFGMRFHPILGYTRMHKGIDFGVPIGTPVMAAGGGIIEEAGRKGGYGNFVLINHGNGYETAYGHLSRFAPGIHAGSRVRQGQIVALSGSTGESTGPHLHYEIRIHKQQVNPLSVKVAKGRILDGRDLREYQIARLHTDAVLASLPLETKVADISTDLRQAKLK
jgi:murein DD-endopeptidase MepM/ murein hydrolase activator NlpD